MFLRNLSSKLRDVRDPHFRRLASLAIIAAVLIYLATQRYLWEKAEAVTDVLLPLSLFTLTQDYVLAIALTCVAATTCFFLAWLTGYWIGMLASAVGRTPYLWPVSSVVELLMDAVYVIPLVLTVSLVYGPLQIQTINEDAWRGWITVATLAVGTFVLAGYQIFDVVTKSTSRPDHRAEALVSSLYFPARQPMKALRARFGHLGRLLDHQIEGYTQAISRSLHLSLVAVVIVEMIVQQLYSHVGFSGDAAYGVGGLVAKQLQSVDTTTVSAFVWALLAYDLLASWLVRKWIDRKYLRFYWRR